MSRHRSYPTLVVLAAVLAVAGAMHAQSAPIGGTNDASVYSNPALYAQRKAQWLGRLETSPRDVNVLEGAAGFFIIRERSVAQDLLERARALEPNNPRWPERLGELHRLNAAQGDIAEALAALTDAERAYSMTPVNDRAMPAGLPQAAFDAGNMPKAAAYAERLLKEALTYKNGWNYGNAIHKANLVLGRVAVREGRLVDAVQFLRAAGATPGSPQLNSFGPNMSLAKDLLDQGETRAVLDYLEQCRVFWKMGGSRLDAWSTAVQAGTPPSFGANLRY